MLTCIFRTYGYNITLISILLASATALSSCQRDYTPANQAKGDERGRNITSFDANFAPLPSVLDLFACKPADLAFVAAHRGTHEGSKFPENTLESLQALHAKGIPFAEIDVARLRDGTQFLFHDGTWERGSTGKGPIAVTSWNASQLLLLKDTNGDLTSFRPSAFADVLAWSKDKMYLEIDFKSSVDEAKVIDSIRAAEMLDQVILISYTTEQAVRLHRLAPDAALSVGIFKPADIKTLEALGIPTNIMTAWTGRGPLTEELAGALRKRNIPILAGSFFDLDDKLQASDDFSAYTKYAKLPDLVVSDYAFDTQPVLEITGRDLREMQKCLAERSGK
ncbi:MAG: glycerophosphodiester phosphodiesterase family protein [Robiginitomaculum sp.]|nr:glycerophosphodiester phosphodiesterase family protein [Robiginitomaculum sp.]